MKKPSPSDSQLTAVDIQLESSWKSMLSYEFFKNYFHHLVDQIKKERENGEVIYPPGPKIFEAFAKTPFDQVKVVILGQDPYHNPGQAMGLSFSVPYGIRVPPSLRNVYKEMKTDLGVEQPNHGNLESWAEQGVFLLNTILTVRQNTPKSHAKLGWNFFTDAVIQTLSQRREHLVFMLWGASAKSKAELIDETKHLILEAAHPSPLARGAYFGSKHFSKANEYLKAHGQAEIDWKLPAAN